MPRRPFIVTTQPGWAFATLSELRAAGSAREYVHFHHRDSTLACRDGLPTSSQDLRTPAEVFGEVVSTTSRRGEDATRQLVRLMRPDAVKRAVLDLLPDVKGTRPRRYSVACEALGRTSVRRQDLAQQVEQVFRTAFPGWRRSSDHAVRIFCKADPDFAFVGVQLHSNLGNDDSGRPGALRRHLACGLLQLAGVDADSLVLDPFMGTGAILETGTRLYQASAAIGFEVDPAACDIAERRLAGRSVSVYRQSFETLDTGLIDSRTRIVTNIPFGSRFERVDTDRLIQVLRRCARAGARITMLASREQGAHLGAALGLRRKNVIVMGQRATILYEGE